MEIFVNGHFLPASQATVSVQDRGLLYGDGLFETIRAEAGRPLWLRQHLERLERSAAAINLATPRAFPWEVKIRDLLERNYLEHVPAAVKILITRGEIADLGLPETEQPTVIIYARKYDPSPAEEYRRGWPVVSFPERRTIFLGRHKSLNYLFCLAARQYAVDQGGREALILEADGTVSEGSTAGILWQEDEKLFTPLAGSALASVTVAVLGEILKRRNVALTAQPVTLDRLALAQSFWLANSLMGLMPVASLDGQAMAVSSETERLNELLWSEAG
jgi:branched-chain amino acid aminotransferase/para-aminobenzoate synthetase component 1